MIYALRTTTGRENVVLEAIAMRIQTKKIPIKSLFRVEELKGYIFIEGEIDDIDEAIKGIQHVRGKVKHEVKFTEIEKFLIPEKMELKVEEGDVVEIISEPFKGDLAKVTRINKVKNEVTVELLEAAIPLPVTLPINAVRIHEKKKENES